MKHPILKVATFFLVLILSSCSKEPLFTSCSFSESESVYLKDAALPPTAGIVYYVDSDNGSSVNSGTSPESPLSSLDDVNAIILNPGDQVLFSRERCFEGSISIEVSGNQENRIVFGAYGTGERPKFFSQDGRSQKTKVKTFSIIKSDHITLQNLDIQGGENAIFISNSNHVIIESCRVGLHSEAGVIATGEHSEGNGSNHGIIRDCLIDSGRRGSTGDLQSTDGIRLIDGASNWSIISNEVRAWAHSGVSIKQIENLMKNNNNRIEGNLFSCGDIDYMRAFDITGGDKLTENNVFYSNIVRQQSVTSHLHGNGNLIAYNLFLGLNLTGASEQPWAIDFHVITNRLGTPGRKELVCYNNMVYNNLFFEYFSGSGVVMLNPKSGADFNVQKNEVINNIFYDVSIPFEIQDEPGSSIISNNLFFSNEEEISFQWNDKNVNLIELEELNGSREFIIKDNLLGNPIFRDGLKEDFHLLESSPAIDQGISVDLLKDFTGKVIENKVDIGPLEF